MAEDFNVDDMEEIPLTVQEMLEKLESESRRPAASLPRTKLKALTVRRYIEDWDARQAMRDEIDDLD